MSKFWISTPRVTGEIETQTDQDTGCRDVIVAAPPVWRRFIGQPSINLILWLERFWGPELEVRRIEEERVRCGRIEG